MGVREITERLAGVPLFSHCSKADLSTIARAGREVSHRDGTVLAREGDPGLGFFLILEGTARVTIGGRAKAKLGAGDFFGEISVLDGGPRSASVIASSPVRLFGITSWVLRGLLKTHPSIGVKMLETQAGRLRRASKERSA